MSEGALEAIRIDVKYRRLSADDDGNNVGSDDAYNSGHIKL